jgi:hypothetical protein
LIRLSPIFLGTLGTPQIKAPLWTPSSKIKIKMWSTLVHCFQFGFIHGSELWKENHMG